MRQSRSAAWSRVAATSRVSVETPGKRILRSTRRAVARSNKTVGRSALSHAPRVQPLHQPKVLGLIGEIAIPETLSDLGGMVPTRVAETVWREISCRPNVELGGHVGNDAGRHTCRIGQERADESGRDNLQRHAETVVIAAPIDQQFAVGIVQVKVTSELGATKRARCR